MKASTIRDSLRSVATKLHASGRRALFDPGLRRAGSHVVIWPQLQPAPREDTPDRAKRLRVPW